MSDLTETSLSESDSGLHPDAWASAGPDPWRALAADVIVSAIRIAALRPEEMVLYPTQRAIFLVRREKEVRWLESPDLLRWLQMAGYEREEIPAVADLVRAYAGCARKRSR